MWWTLLKTLGPYGVVFVIGVVIGYRINTFLHPRLNRTTAIVSKVTGPTSIDLCSGLLGRRARPALLYGVEAKNPEQCTKYLSERLIPGSTVSYEIVSGRYIITDESGEVINISLIRLGIADCTSNRRDFRLAVPTPLTPNRFPWREIQ